MGDEARSREAGGEEEVLDLGRVARMPSSAVIHGTLPPRNVYLDPGYRCTSRVPTRRSCKKGTNMCHLLHAARCWPRILIGKGICTRWSGRR